MPQNKNKTKIAAIALLCALAVVYVGYHIASIFKDEANLFLVEPVTEYNTMKLLYTPHQAVFAHIPTETAKK